MISIKSISNQVCPIHGVRIVTLCASRLHAKVCICLGQSDVVKRTVIMTRTGILQIPTKKFLIC